MKHVKQWVSKRRWRIKALSYAVIYMALAGLWILLSGKALELLVGLTEIRGDLEVYKGLLFVLLTGMALYALLRSWQNDLPESTTPEVPGDTNPVGLTPIRLPIIYLLALVLIIASGGYVVFENMKRSEQQKIEQNLSAIADLKAEQVNGWLRQNINFSAAAGNGSYLASSFEIWARDGTLPAAQDQWVHKRLDTLRQSYPYGDITLYDLKGKPYLTTGKTFYTLDHEPTLLPQVIESKHPAIGKMHWHDLPDGTRYVSLPMLAPLAPSGINGPVVGALMFELNPEQYLFPMIKSWPTPSQSAETMLVQRSGEDVMFLNELRHQKGTSLSTLRIESNPHLLATQAALGKTGFINGVDYRGIPVIGYALKIPNTGWMMVAKVDAEEIEQPIRQIAFKVALTAFVLAFVGSLSLYFWWRQRKTEYETARIKAELQQQVLSERFDYLSKYANDIILLMDERGVILEANDRAETAYGYSHQELLGNSIFMLRQQDETFDFKRFKQTLGEKKSMLFESCHHRRDGSLFPVEISTRLIETEYGTFIQSIIRDISERKQAEESLRASESRLSMLFNNMTNGFAVHQVIRDAAGKVVDHLYLEVNPALEKMTGMSRDRLIGKRIKEVLPGVEDYWIDNYAEVANTGIPRNIENYSSVLDRWYSVYAYRPAPEQVATLVQDISERKQAEQRAHRLTNIYRALSETNDAIIRLEDESALFPLACRIAVEFGGMMLAWVGIPDKSQEFIVSAASYGSAAGYIEGIRILLAGDGLESQGPSAITFREAHTVIVNDFNADPLTMPWRERAHQYGIQASASFPILRKRVPYAVFTVYSDQINTFDDEIVTLLEEISSNLSFALDNFDREASRHQALEDLCLAATVFESSHSSIMIVDPQIYIVAVNPAFTHVTGYSADEVIGKNPRLLQSGRQGKDFYQAFWSALENAGRWQGEIWNCRKNGEEYAAWLSVSALKDEHGVTKQYIGITDDITESKENQSRIEFLAYHDALTRLPNRMLANDRLEQAIAHAHRSRSRVAVLFLDLDDFKTINDTLGHTTGDVLLKAVADRLRHSVREADTVSRQGGDEFLVMLSDVTELEAINTVAANILEEVGRPYRIGEHDLSISTSIGIAIYPEDGQDCDTLLKNADMAMYNAKQSGRNTHRFFAEEMNDYVLEHLLIRNGLQRALENQEFLLHYQPQLDLAEGRLIGAEALIRWQHPELGMVPPNRFVQVAEESGMIVPIGNWVLKEACRQAVEWQNAGWPGLVVGVNISAVQFRRGDMDQIVAAALAESGLEPQFLELELTESILIQDVEKSLNMIQNLKDLGVRLSIDDFGTGYSSLSYLRQLPVDKLKIDQSFVKEITTRRDDAAIALSIITLAHTLQKRVIAEGVETIEQLRFMQQHGCDEIQGYLFSRPLTADGFADFLQQKGMLDILDDG